MKLSVPFIPDEKYTDFLKNKTLNIESIYFSLHSGQVLDSRLRFKETGLHELSKGLQALGSVKKYCLLNSRFIHPGLYNDKLFLNQVLDKLEFLVSHSTITGIVFSDAYFLNAMAATKRDVISCLEAVPGINCMIDSSQKAVSFFEIIEQTGFKLPGKIVLDRSLNRNLKQLEKTGNKIKQQYSPIKIELLANEGCIYYCPFKFAHDAQISFSNLRITTDKTLRTNQRIGCHAHFFKTPENFLKSPFIRPEDMDRYKGMADSIKLCGRTLGINFLFNCIEAYIKKSYKGNLFNLMDAAYWLSDLYHIKNKNLDPGFFNTLTGCTKDCKRCNICQDLFIKTAKKKSLEIKNYKDCL
ncbi:MAG: hypothetical protein KKE44_01080 [Proteobacteria bacterium]|nr:hypothetical protein [Pseudomonadota bacterium]MBU1581320.1 hypothetical protein [Pseudomonadota bacterium]MBU2627185.1 hypothetical protein [Pseudomonadota bacterium]